MAGIEDTGFRTYLNPGVRGQRQTPSMDNGGITTLRSRLTGPVLDMDEVRTRTNEFSSMLTANMPKPPSAKEIDSAYQEIMSQYMNNPRSVEEIMAEDQETFGDAEDSHATLQAYLALAKFGAQMANTPGSLLQGLTKPMPELMTDLSKVAALKQSQKSQRTREAREIAREEANQYRNTRMNTAMGALQQASAEQNMLTQAKMNANNQALNTATDVSKWTAESLWQVAQDNSWDLKNAERVPITVPDPNSPLGYKEQNAFIVNTPEGPMTITENEDGTYSRRTPGEYRTGGFEDNFDVDRDEAGRIIAIDKISGESTVFDQTGEVLGHTLVPGHWKIKGVDPATGEQIPEYVGNPMVENVDPPTLNMENINTEQYTKRTETISAGEEVLEVVNGMMTSPGFSDIMGPGANVQRFMSKTIGAAFDADWATNLNRTALTSDLELIRKVLARAMASTDRFAWADLKQGMDLLPNAEDFFQNPRDAMVRMQEVARMVYNTVSRSRAEISNPPNTPFPQLARVPQGTVDDPFDVMDTKQSLYLELANDRGEDLNGIMISMTAEQAKASDGPSWTWMNKNPQERVQFTIGADIQVVPDENRGLVFDIPDERPTSVNSGTPRRSLNSGGSQPVNVFREPSRVNRDTPRRGGQ